MLDHEINNRNNIPLRTTDKVDVRPTTEISKSNPTQYHCLFAYETW